MHKKLIEDARERLEDVLNKGFPKVEEEGSEKIAMKRGPALAIFAEALIIIQQTIRAFGGCEKCYGKGYGTETTFADGGGTRVRMNPISYCSCDRGEQLKKIITRWEL